MDVPKDGGISPKHVGMFDRLWNKLHLQNDELDGFLNLNVRELLFIGPINIYQKLQPYGYSQPYIWDCPLFQNLVPLSWEGLWKT